SAPACWWRGLRGCTRRPRSRFVQSATLGPWPNGLSRELCSPRLSSQRRPGHSSHRVDRGSARLETARAIHSPPRSALIAQRLPAAIGRHRKSAQDVGHTTLEPARILLATSSYLGTSARTA